MISKILPFKMLKYTNNNGIQYLQMLDIIHDATDELMKKLKNSEIIIIPFNPHEFRSNFRVVIISRLTTQGFL